MRIKCKRYGILAMEQSSWYVSYVLPAWGDALHQQLPERSSQAPGTRSRLVHTSEFDNKSEVYEAGNDTLRCTALRT
eukprot:3587508-Pyramimonas_sp.AAC.1